MPSTGTQLMKSPVVAMAGAEIVKRAKLNGDELAEEDVETAANV